jgi:hypothetical protein
VETVNSISARKAQDAIEVLLAENLLKPLAGGESGPRYAFVEEGLPTLIWMIWAQRNLNREAATPRAATAS